MRGERNVGDPRAARRIDRGQRAGAVADDDSAVLVQADVVGVVAKRDFADAGQVVASPDLDYAVAAVRDEQPIRLRREGDALRSFSPVRRFMSAPAARSTTATESLLSSATKSRFRARSIAK
jgi:hypothetical protein